MLYDTYITGTNMNKYEDYIKRLVERSREQDKQLTNLSYKLSQHEHAINKLIKILQEMK